VSLWDHVSAPKLQLDPIKLRAGWSVWSEGWTATCRHMCALCAQGHDAACGAWSAPGLISQLFSCSSLPASTSSALPAHRRFACLYWCTWGFCAHTAHLVQHSNETDPCCSCFCRSPPPLFSEPARAQLNWSCLPCLHTAGSPTWMGAQRIDKLCGWDVQKHRQLAP
jgi:hypothetical protein